MVRIRQEFFRNCGEPTKSQIPANSTCANSQTPGSPRAAAPSKTVHGDRRGRTGAYRQAAHEAPAVFVGGVHASNDPPPHIFTDLGVVSVALHPTYRASERALGIEERPTRFLHHLAPVLARWEGQVHAIRHDPS